MHLRMMLGGLLFTILPFAAWSDTGRTITVNFSTAMLTVQHGQSTVFETAVVLPRGNYYPVPIRGTVQRSMMGPRWTPTQNMHRDYPGRYKQSYGPYEAGNAMGHCKIYIDFERTAEFPILNTVRIHGNARTEDLGLRKSRSCIRIPDSLCQTMVEVTQRYQEPVTVQFVR